MIGLLGVAAPQVYYRYQTVPAPIIAPVVVSSEVPVVVKTVTKKKIVSKSNVVIPVVTPEVKVHIEEVFGKDSKVATATLMHESGLVLNKKGYNCHYYKTNKKGVLIRYSRACDTADRHLAWSVDCGIAQINVKGQVCPPKLLTLEGNMEAAKKIYETQGLNAWYSYKSGAYKKFLLA